MLKQKFSAKEARAWSARREDGRTRWVLSRGVLGWGGTMFVFMTFWKLFTDGAEAITASRIIINLIVWPISGAGFGLCTWNGAEKAYREYLSSEKNENKPNEAT